MGHDLENIVDNQLSYVNKLSLNKLKKVVYTIGNTRVLDDSKYYVTPIREYEEFIVIGIIVFSENEAKIVLQKIDGLVDYIFIDCEKKSKNISEGFFNIERLSHEIITKSTLKFYKGNDLTVESIDNFIFYYFLNNEKLLGGLNILIIGIGNIGFKIALKLLERGANIFLSSSNEKRAENLCALLNDIKPKETLASAKPFIQENEQVLLDCIIFTGLAPKETNTIYLKNNIKKETLILDVGKGCLNPSQLDLLQKSGIIPYRLDIGESLQNKIKIELSSKFKFKLPRAIQIDKDLTLVEIGIVGKKGDILVKSIAQPILLIGMCDGKGGLINLVQDEKKDIINRLERKFSKRNH